MPEKTLGEVVREVRESRGLTPAQLAEKAQVALSLVLAMEGGISISEDPNIRFTYVSNGAKRFRAEAQDTGGHMFRNEWDVEKPGM